MYYWMDSENYIHALSTNLPAVFMCILSAQRL